MRHFTSEENERIQAAIAAVEARTHAHFALAVTPLSDRYALYPVAWGAVLALLVGGLVALGWPQLPIRMGFSIEAAVFVVFSLLFDWLPLRLALVPRRLKHAHARRMAHREFAARILSDQKHRDGVLFFVSRGERYVELLASPDVHARIGTETWETIIAAFVGAVKSGRETDGFIAGIEACGAALALHYPAAG